MKVRSAVLREMGAAQPYAESRPLEIVELELDPPGPGELLVRVGAAGLCHSDLSVIDGSRPRVMPMALGHEAAGEVVETGPGVGGLRAPATTSSSPSSRPAGSASRAGPGAPRSASPAPPRTPPARCSAASAGFTIPAARRSTTTSASRPSPTTSSSRRRRR